MAGEEEEEREQRERRDAKLAWQTEKCEFGSGEKECPCSRD